MKEYNINVNFKEGSIDTDFIGLVQNDYNSTLLNFKFDTTDRVVIKILYPDGETAYIDDVIDNKVLLSEGMLSQEGTYQIELSAYNNDSGKLTDYATMSFYTRPELINTDEIVEPDDRIPILDNLITEVENIDVSAEKVDTTTTVAITKKDGTVEQVEILDGEIGPQGRDGVDGKSLEFNWNNTQLGIRQEGQSEYQYQDLKGDTGASGRDGTNGVDGFSPTASVSKSGSTATITITDKNGTTTAQVSDGEDAPIYTAGENITIENNVISALPGITFTVEDGKLVIDYE